MSNLIAYIPVLNQRHLNWFQKHPNSSLHLISQERAESLIPYLSRHMAAVPTSVQLGSISYLDAPWQVKNVAIFDPENLDPCLNSPLVKWKTYILPDEDVSHALVEKYFTAARANVVFEDIHARWDMTAVKRASPVMVDVDHTSDPGHNLRLNIARQIAPKSPDWWRQVGAALFVNGTCVAFACNEHYPTEYEQDLMGDPRMVFNAGQPGKYLSLHSERAVIAFCAQKGIPTWGSYLYVTTFPCEDCAREIVAAGVHHVFFEEGYSALNAQEVLKSHGVKIVQVAKDPVSP